MKLLRTHAAKVSLSIGAVGILLIGVLGQHIVQRCAQSSDTSYQPTHHLDSTRVTQPHPTTYHSRISDTMSIPVYTVEVLRTIPHDAQAFTQGLAFSEGELYESTGQYGASSLRKVDPETGKVLKKLVIDEAYFAEGVVVVQGKVYQLTWQSGIGFVYDAKTFRQLRTFSYFGEGWGLTYDGEHMIMSDGTSGLRLLDPDSLMVRKMLYVTANGVPVKNLNELEVVKGEIWANVWQTDSIARISPLTGHVIGWIDCSGLLTPEERSRADVLNGIAYNSAKDIILLTGKNWSKMFEVRVKIKEKM
ncbi:MAG: glutaminyl-peptide cyclotransferase [Bacteroidota bacterium]|nr:glutaminyl-peptide cyclotransferase [Candidatus Kapabacteria bacterium]MDW8219365.1 glutaminyl-peptide cyclotransferase [Bacteroidota bacterium]